MLIFMSSCLIVFSGICYVNYANNFPIPGVCVCVCATKVNKNELNFGEIPIWIHIDVEFVFQWKVFVALLLL